MQQQEIVIKILFTIFQLIYNQTQLRLVPNQSEYGKYNLISSSSTRTRSQILIDFSLS